MSAYPCQSTKLKLTFEPSEIWNKTEFKVVKKAFKAAKRMDAKVNLFSNSIINSDLFQERFTDIASSLNAYFTLFQVKEKAPQLLHSRLEKMNALAERFRSDLNIEINIDLAKQINETLPNNFASEDISNEMVQSMIEFTKDFLKFAAKHRSEFSSREILSVLGCENINDSRVVPEKCLDVYLNELSKIIHEMKITYVFKNLTDLEMLDNAHRYLLIDKLVQYAKTIVGPTPICNSRSMNPMALGLDLMAMQVERRQFKKIVDECADPLFQEGYLEEIKQTTNWSNGYINAKDSDERYQIALKIINSAQMSDKGRVHQFNIPISLQICVLYTVSIRNKDLSLYFKSLTNDLCNQFKKVKTQSQHHEPMQENNSGDCVLM